MESKFKFNSLKVFGSSEYLYGNIKKYRRVYDESESCYMYAELAFYNKEFDEQDWNAKVKLECFNTKTGERLCELIKDIPVTKDSNVIYVREGWGTPDPGWWKEGVYRWDTYIDEVFVGNTYFYIVNGGKIAANNNPYFDIEAVKLFESPRGGMPINERKYLKKFKKDTTRYINIEVSLRSKKTHWDSMPVELQFNVYNDSGQQKAYVEYFYNITDRRPTLIFDTGYGSQSGGYWFSDVYTIEIICMDVLLGVVPFEVGDVDEAHEGSLPFQVGASRIALQTNNTEAPPTTDPTGGRPSFETAVAELNSLIGLEAVKTEIQDFATYLKFIQIRKNKGFDENQKFNLNIVFTGNPGTGKTTVARMLGKIYYSLGLLSRGHVHEIGRVDLVAEYIGQTAPKVKKAIEQAKGGILFIDEAYSLTDRGDDKKDFGREVIEVLLKEMSDGTGDLGIIFAGYPKEMQDFMQANPGITSRIQDVIHFPDYNPEELMQIVEFTANQRAVLIAEDAKIYIHRKLVEMYRNRDQNFGNARVVNGVIEEAKQNMAIRLMQNKDVGSMNKEELSTIRAEDVEKVFRTGNNAKITVIPVDEPLLSDAMLELRELVGIDSVKKEVEEIIKLVRYYRDIGRDVRKAFSIHTVFTGNPGTGKTTVARILVRIYKALGILERGHVIEVDRQGLVAGWVGQTAIKTDEMIQKAMGGGLFIDEAYSLASGGANDFGGEVIETLLKRMEDHRGQFMVIVAGYPKEMQRFLEANPGLMSRFDKQFHFEDYSKDELLQIATTMFQKDDLELSSEAELHLGSYIQKLLDNKHKYFGNARTIRKIVQEVVRKQNLRLANVPTAQRTYEMIRAVSLEDVSDFKLLEEQNSNNNQIGFRKE